MSKKKSINAKNVELFINGKLINTQGSKFALSPVRMQELALILLDRETEIRLTSIYGVGPINSVLSWTFGPWRPEL